MFYYVFFFEIINKKSIKMKEKIVESIKND